MRKCREIELFDILVNDRQCDSALFDISALSLGGSRMFSRKFWHVTFEISLKSIKFDCVQAMTFSINSSNNSLKSYKTFKNIDQFMDFYRDVINEKITLVHIPLKIGTQKISNIIQDTI